MGYFQKLIDQLKDFLTWWIMLNPWEKGIRVRFGKNIKMLEKGIYFKIPIFDKIYVQTVRSRNINTSIQTISTSDGIAISIGMIIQYSIQDIYKLYNTLYHPEMTIQNMMIGEVSKYITNTRSNLICSQNIIDNINKSFDGSKYGLVIENVSISTYAIVRTYRLIQDSSWISEGYNLDDIKNK